LHAFRLTIQCALGQHLVGSDPCRVGDSRVHCGFDRLSQQLHQASIRVRSTTYVKLRSWLNLHTKLATTQIRGTQIYSLLYVAMVFVWCLGHQGGRSTCARSKEKVSRPEANQGLCPCKETQSDANDRRKDTKPLRHCRNFCELLLKLSSVLPPSRPLLHPPSVLPPYSNTASRFNNNNKK